MAWNIGLFEFENNLLKIDENFDELSYFDVMVEEIRKIFIFKNEDFSKWIIWTW
jgi:hypothetical protein